MNEQQYVSDLPADFMIETTFMEKPMRWNIHHLVRILNRTLAAS